MTKVTFFADNNLAPIADIGAGESHSSVLLQDGSVYASGLAACLGNEELSGNIVSFVKVEFDKPLLFTSLYCSHSCTLISTNDGIWYAFGNSSKQRSPYFGAPLTRTPSRVDAHWPKTSSLENTTELQPVKIKKLVHSLTAFFMLSEDNQLYVVGSNAYGELGMQASGNDVSNWSLHPFVKQPVGDVFAGRYTSFILYNNYNNSN